MKIRNGFVSNSSTSSFLIYGISLEDSSKFTVGMIKGFKEKFPEKFSKYLEAMEKKTWLKDYFDLLKKIDGLTKEEVNRLVDFIRDDPIDAIELLTGFKAYCPYDCYYIGRSWDTIKDDETGLQFKQSVEEKIKTLFGDEVKCETYECAWRDG